MNRDTCVATLPWPGTVKGTVSGEPLTVVHRCKLPAEHWPITDHECNCSERPLRTTGGVTPVIKWGAIRLAK